MPKSCQQPRHFRADLDRYDPVTGLNDHPEVVAFHRLVFITPSLAGRLTRYQLEDEEVLTPMPTHHVTPRDTIDGIRSPVQYRSKGGYGYST
ncbi:hypothetical protein ACF1A5_12240 [Streptomyces sp. NPDC014864]|uniref:hypothetical protein n=1 Tax=Streptomyces sp. NPDC014864 TaxID=3364924 RepID=UPI0036FE78EA